MRHLCRSIVGSCSLTVGTVSRCCFHNELCSVAGTVHGDDIFVAGPRQDFAKMGATLVHRRFQKYTYIIGCTVGENIDEYWNVDGERELSDAWTGFTRIILLNERPPDGKTWSGWRLTRKTNNLSPRQCMARYVEAYV